MWGSIAAGYTACMTHPLQPNRGTEHTPHQCASHLQMNASTLDGASTQHNIMPFLPPLCLSHQTHPTTPTPTPTSHQGPGSDIFKLVLMAMNRGYDPLIVFSFSKRECEQLALSLGAVDLNSSDEKQLVEGIYK